ncbi:MAG: DNA-binding protein [marine bacterium B5-7]|nr:MAG: DNA-binding protein [marine bacterium B5-7]
MKLQGKVLNWNDDRGFGFVEPNGGGERAFVHIKAFNPRSRRPINGDVIIYELVRENNNRYKATNIQFARDVKSLNKQNNANSTNTFGIYCTLIFCGVLLASIISGKLPLIVAGLYVVMSLVTFIAYAIDKSAAQNARWRTPESTLHIFSLIGGWPGAFFAQNMLRHKSSKQEFKSVYKITVLLNLGALIWLHTEKGMIVLNNIFSPLLNG